MAKGYYNPNDDVVGAPTGWTRRFNLTTGTFSVEENPSGSGNKFIRINLGGTARCGYSYDAAEAHSDRADCEVVFEWSCANDSQLQLVGLVRASGSAGSESCYLGGINNATANGHRLLKYVSGASTQISSAPATLTAGTVYRTRTRVHGSELHTKTWPAASPEPSGWDLSDSDTSLSAPGALGVFNFGSNRTYWISWFGWATGGDNAPLPGESASTPIAFSGAVPNRTATVGTPFALSLSGHFAGSEAPFTYAIHNGALPSGLSLSGAMISGTPSVAETKSNIVVRATDAANAVADTNPFQIAVQAANAAVRGVRVQLHDGAVPRANCEGLAVAWFDASTPANFEAPAFKTSSAATDSDGWLEIDIDAVTTLALGATGYVHVLAQGASAPDDLVFAGRLVVEDVG